MKKTVLLFTILFGTLVTHAERVELIKNATQIFVNNIDTENGGTVGNLIDNNATTTVHTQKDVELTSDCYIRITLDEPLNLNPEEDLVVFLQRCSHNESEGHPTVFKVEGSTDGKNWENDWDENITSCHAYFLYRGPNTKEYSTRIHTSKPFQYLRFTVKTNSGRKHDSQGHRYMGLSEFQIYKLGRNDNYSATWIDRLHLTTDYFRALKEYEFENTQGILDQRNRNVETNIRNEEITNWTDWSAWKDGKWTKDAELLEKAGIEMPDYTMLTSDNDGGLGYRPNPGQKRQPTHVTEHVLYAIPGDAIALYPYYRFTAVTNYHVNFTHWYDYKSGGHLNTTDATTGKAISMLDFLIDPSSVHKNDKYGYFAGKEFGEINIKISTPEEYIAYANAVNVYNTDAWQLKAQIVADLDFSGYTNVPSLGKDNYYGTLEGNGHKISNLIMNRPNDTGVGLVHNAGNDAVVRNLIIDNTCKFIGKDKVAALYAQETQANGRRIDNVQTYAYVEATDGQAAALIGGTGDKYTPQVEINNCYVEGTVKGKKAAAVAIWDNLKVNNTVSKATVGKGESGEKGKFVESESKSPVLTLTNCYGNYNDIDQDKQNIPTDPATLGDGWETRSGYDHIVPKVILADFEPTNSNYGKVATFFCPRSPYADEGKLQNLPFGEGEDEFIIAADFSQSFSTKHNLVNKTVIEPVIQFRHIFRIRDGKKFAEEFSGSEAANKEYVRKNLRRVSARANVPFQIRLDSPIPQKGTTRSKYYYKISDHDYRRVCTMDLEIKDLNTGNIIQRLVIDENGYMTDGNGTNIMMDQDNPIEDKLFYYGDEFNGEGSRKIGEDTYNLCGGGGKYYLMLKCNNLQPGHYLIRVIGNDINGNNIKIYGSDELLTVMEIDLIAMPESAASLVDEETLYNDEKYAHAREEALEKNYGAPRQRLTFDEYATLETLANKSNYLDGSNNKYKYKWPMPWKSVTYSFDYNMSRDFNMYSVASHSSKTQYHKAADTYINPDGSDGLYDRLYYKTYRQGQTVKHGYFYYINASADPGVMARLNMESLCMGSTIHVSAWIAEFSDDTEVSNISFNFVAVLKDGKERVPLHSFISGYVPREKLGRWMNIYYSFVPNYSETGLTPDMIDHYELELDNNCKSSAGADYAIDNIRLYVASPLVYAEQRDPVCDKKLTEMTVTIETPFDVMLQVLGETEAEAGEKNTNLYYTFIDKKAFDAKYAEYSASGEQAPGQKAYEESVLHFNYEHGGDGEQTYGKASFNLNYVSNPEYDKDNYEITPECSRRTDEDGTRLITFNTRPSNLNLGTGKEYYVSIYPDVTDGEIEPTWSEFDINNPCARMCVFRVRPTSVIKIDGEVREDADDITCCENQSPVVQVDIWGKSSDTAEPEPVEKNARLDWYSGSYESFVNEKSETDILLSDALTIFRTVYPDAEDCNVSPTDDLTGEMIDYLKKMSTEIPTGENRPRLCLSQTSFVFPPTVIPEGEDYNYIYVVAIPISSQKDNVLLCTMPTEVRMRVQHAAPILNHGLRSDIPYPESMIDVPLRIGLRQLQEASAAESADIINHSPKLNIPVRRIFKVSETATEMRRIVTNPYILLVETNDPEYKDLGTIDSNGDDTGTLLRVGEITSILAKVEDTNENKFQVVFYNTFRFKEGYYYRMRFFFEEDASDISTDEDVMCLGQDVFTVKVVPEYQRWIGNEKNISRNWNNDANWERVSSTDLYLTEERKNELNDYVTDGLANSNRRSYTPMEFTKVIIPHGSIFPHLGQYQYKEIPTLDYPNLKKIKWTLEPFDDISGEATSEIQFDMAAYKPSKWDIACRPWYVNTCEQIHFLPKSEITGQEELIYDKAWVDIAITPGIWYTLSTPLQTVYAGDMYLPSDNGRQESELFADIEFDAKKNNRFNPAVYQRGWDKSTANVYKIKDGPVSNVAVKAAWSNVYNDVIENYGGGTGFSIKTDASKIENCKEVVFRLPKSDNFFEYYSEDGVTIGNKTVITRQPSSQFKLNNIVPYTPNNKIIAKSAGTSRYFLVGNPLMAHLDMKKFFETNKEKINPKYWILTEGSQKVGVFEENSDGFVGSADGFVAPMQGFFVEAKDNAAYQDGNDMILELNYSADMACIGSFDDSPLKVRTRSDYADSNNIVKISAMRGNRLLSQAFINYSQNADKAYNEAEDAVLIDNSQLEIPVEVYTVADHTAMSINATNYINGTEIGLISEDDNETVLVFEGVNELNDVSLYDAAAQTSMPLSEGMKYTVKGNVTDRLYLLSNCDNSDSKLQSIKMHVTDRNVIIEAGRGTSISAKVYTADGIMIYDRLEDSPVMEFHLAKGFYILVATDGIETIKRKILIQ